MLTIKEVAELAGVSKSIVFRVLNNNGYVSNEARQKIEKVIKGHQYKLSVAAVSLSRRESSVTDVMVPEIDNPFFAEVLKGTTEVVDRNGFSLIFYNT